MNPLQRTATVVNKAVAPLVASPRWGRILDPWMTILTYAGRRSGATFSLPVAYRRRGDAVTIRVSLPDQKTWWRNFRGDGRPVQLRLGGVDRAGHAIAHRSPTGAVRVDVELSS